MPALKRGALLVRAAMAGHGTIAAETDDQASAIERVLDRAFGPGRHAKTSERVREQGAVLNRAVSRVAVENGRLVGCCRIWAIGLDRAPAFFLGPLAVDPDWQGHGLARPMIAAALEAARQTPAVGVLVIGRPALFSGHGFQLAARGSIQMPGPIPWERLQTLSFTGQPFAGRLSPPPAASPA